MRVCSIGSGSKGNGTLIQTDKTLLLVDCGFGLRDTLKRIESKGLSPESLHGIFVTHEHSDHGKGVGMVAKKLGIPVYASAGTLKALKDREILSDVHEVYVVSTDNPVEIEDLKITPVVVPHDSRECTQFVFESFDNRFGLLTDLGSITPHVIDLYQGCEHIFLEFNHDPDMLWEGPYPESLKDRVGGRLGHLSNEQAMSLLTSLDQRELKNIVVSHVSEQNNHFGLVQQILETRSCHQQARVCFSDQSQGCDWIECH